MEPEPEPYDDDAPKPGKYTTQPTLKRQDSMEKKKIVKVDPLKKTFLIVSCNLEAKKWWDILICMFVLYNAFQIPFELAFSSSLL